MSADTKVVGDLIHDFIAYSFEHGGTDITDEAMRIARLLAGQDPTRLAARLLDQVPELVEETAEPVEAIQHALAGGALIARHLLEQAGGDEDRARTYFQVFIPDWTRLFLGIPMKHAWIRKPNAPSLFKDLDR